MTTIVMVESGDHVDVAFDSKVSAGFSHAEMEQSKVFEASGILYGVAGALSVANAIEGTSVKPPKTNDPDEINKWVTFDLLGSIRKTLSRMQVNGRFQFPGEMLIVVKNRVYSIGPDYSRLRHTSGKYAIGSGGNFALGALANGASAEKAVQVAADHDVFTGHRVKSFEYVSPV